MKRKIIWGGQKLTVHPFVNQSMPKIVRVKIWEESIPARTTKVTICKEGGDES